jgi:long-chain acyl-CoA synthetase
VSEELSWQDAVAQLTAPSQMFEMEEREIRGVLLRTWKAAPPTLRTILDLSLGHGDEDFVVYEDRRTTFAQHYRAASALAHRLRDELGVQKGDRVAIAMRNLPEWITTFWGAIAAGAVVVPLNAWWTGGELAYGLKDSGSVVVVLDDDRAARIFPHRRELPDLRAVVLAHEADGAGEADGATVAFGELLGEVAAGEVPPDVGLEPDDDATIFYTSGTTGQPKGAVGTHRNTCTNLMNLFFFQTVSRLRFGAGPADQGDAPRRSYLLTVPLFHATGCIAVLVPNTAAGSKLVLMHHFDPERALELIEREKVTAFGGVPTVVMRVLDSPDLPRRDISSIRSVSYGGAPAPADLVRRIKETFPSAQASNGYGLTETSAATALNVGADYLRKPDSVGHVVPIADVAVVPEGFAGTEPPRTPPGSVGELWVKGPHVVRGYWQRPGETAAVLSTGWLHTGDVGRIDDEGFLFVVDRAKDVVIRGGENVYSVEVEDALFSHPAVADCAVIGVPHPVLGEEVGAAVVLRPGHRVGTEELAAHVRRRLAEFNVPTHFWFVPAPLPRNPAGKVLKRELRSQLLGSPGDARPASGTA